VRRELPLRPTQWLKRWPLWLLLAAVLGWGLAWWRYPSDRTPEGAYLRVMSAVNQGQPQRFFAYLETQAQHACFTIGDYRAKSRALVEADYPEALRAPELERLGVTAAQPDGPDVFAYYAHREGWFAQLRKDLSGIDQVEVHGERASVQTARGTRYPFRRRDNGIWGLTLFTATLVEEAERAARDFELIESAAADYRRAANTDAPRPSSLK